MNIKEGYMPFKGNKTYYRIVNPNGKKIPLIFLHGGPGSTHNYFEIFDDMAFEDDRPLIMYDQIGCGNSYTAGDKKLFVANTWIEELCELRKYLNIDNAHILGSSWGGMLAIYYAIEKSPNNVCSYILSSTLSSAKLWKEEQFIKISYMPEEMQKAIYYAIENNDYDNEEYKKALDEFMKRHCFDKSKYIDIECISRDKKFGKESYEIGWGKNEFLPTGTLKDYDFTDRLCEIDKPCLIINGSNDLSSPYQAKIMYDNITNSKWELFQYSKHVPFVEEHSKYKKILIKWLNENDLKGEICLK